MPLHTFSREEIALVRDSYPGLILNYQGVWSGILQIDAQHEGHRIQDRYDVEIGAPAGYPERMPFLREVGGRTQAIAAKYEITDLRTLHYNPKDGTACVCVRQEEKVRFTLGSNLTTFIKELAVPYLYGLSFYDTHGRWPWKEYSHGGLGILEFHADDPNEPTEQHIREVASHLRADDKWKDYGKQIRKLSPDKHCICGSERPFRKCHADAWQGMMRLHSDIVRLGLNARSLFHQNNI